MQYEPFEPTAAASAVAGYISAFKIDEEAFEGFARISLGKNVPPPAARDAGPDAAAWRRWRVIDALLAHFGSFGALTEGWGDFVAENYEPNEPSYDGQ